MFGDHKTASYIAQQLYAIDIKLRQRFIYNKSIINENQYTTLLSEFINSQLGGLFPIYTSSSLLRPKHERKFGCDCIIIFKYENKVKIGLFEAKWLNRKNWDYPQHNNPSHFTDQISRQCSFSNEIAIWETFYNSDPPINDLFFISNQGSTCIWHSDIHAFQKLNVINRHWQKKDTEILISSKGQTFYQIIYNILMCNNGKIMNIEEKSSITINSNSIIEDEIKIPIPDLTDSEYLNYQSIDYFMKETGISHYTAINLTGINLKHSLKHR